MADIVAKIMVELISILALAKKQIGRGRLSKQGLSIIELSALTSECVVEQFAKKLLGDSEIETILKRLDRLTQEESRMTVAQSLAIVHGLLNNMKAVMDGEWGLLSIFKVSELATVHIGGEASTSAIRQTLGTFFRLSWELSGLMKNASHDARDRE